MSGFSIFKKKIFNISKMVTYNKYKPASALKDYIRFYFYYQCIPEGGYNTPQRIVPLGNPELVIPISFPYDLSQTSTYFNAYIDNFCSEHTFTKINSSVRLIGVSFYPWAVPVLLGLQTSELSNRIYSVEQALPEFKEMVQQVSEVADPLNATVYLDNFFLTKLNSGKNEDILVSHMAKSILLSRGIYSLRGMHSQHNLTEKQAVDRFKRSIGLPPKRYMRLARFHNALKQLKMQKQRFTDIAYNCGYFDQAHFINEFRYFSGTTPKKYIYEQHPITDLMLTS